MRFCKNCGLRLQDGLAAPAGPAAAPAAAPAYAPPAAAPAPVGAAPARAAEPAVCWRCRGVGDPGVEFCKFCGARYKDAPPASAWGSQPLAPGYPAAPSQSPMAMAAAQAAAPASPPHAAPIPAPIPAQVFAPQPLSVPSAPYAAPPAAPQPLPAPAPSAAGQAEPLAKLVAILKDGTDGRVFPLYSEQSDVGRTEGDVVLGDDPYLSPRHARIRRKGAEFTIRDLESVNGIFLRLREPVDLGDGDVILIGQQVLRFELLADGEQPIGPAMQQGVLLFGTPEVPRIARLVQYTTEGVGRDVHYLYRDETVLGRENGDIVFTDDPFLSRRHASITADRASKRYVLRDLGSSNGTAIRFTGERTIAGGDQFRIGRHLFRFESGGRPR